MTKEAAAEVTAHAKESLQDEICGVLVGELCEDEAGTWVLVKAAIRGTAAKQAGTHVTYTQETWNAIYEVKDQQYQDLHIVGWYHSHPGFGVEFSAMDRFIQENYFGAAHQFALVLDPLGGDEAVCVNTPDGIQYIGAYWIEGRKRLCKKPTHAGGQPSRPGSSTQEEGVPGAMAVQIEKRLKALEDRVHQFLVMAEEDRAARYRWLLVVGFIVALSAVGLITYTVYQAAYGPRELRQVLPVGIQIGARPAMIPGPPFEAVVTWRVPPEFEAVLRELEKRKREEEASKSERKKADEPKLSPNQSEQQQPEAKPGEKTGRPGGTALPRSRPEPRPGSSGKPTPTK